jgi:hypothetical protein
MSEPHEVVKLLIKRMESHPEEFKKDADRWDRVLVEVLEHADEAEIAAIHASIRNIRLGEAHEDMMDELCNGEERRRKEVEDREYELHLAHAVMQQKQQQQALAQQQKAYVSQIQGMVGQVYGGGGGGAGLVQGTYDSDLDKYRNTPTGSITSAFKPKPSPYDKIMNALKRGK